MDVYFIRHGETEGNRKHRHQFPDTPLNELGHKQATIVAALAPSYAPTHLISSTLKRAEETTAKIAATTHLEPIKSDIFIEIQRPSHIHGLHYADPRSLWYLVRWFLSGYATFNDAERGESYCALIARIEQAKRFLELYPKDARLILVSHSVFINFFVAHICSDKPISFFGAFLRFAKIINLDNSSISHVRYNPDAAPNTCAWELVSFDNDDHVVS